MIISYNYEVFLYKTILFVSTLQEPIIRICEAVLGNNKNE